MKRLTKWIILIPSIVCCLVGSVYAAAEQQQEKEGEQEVSLPVTLSGGIRAGVGLSPMWIVGNIANLPIREANGSGFGLGQFAAGLRIRVPLDDDDNIRIVVGGEYASFSSRQRFPFVNADILASNEFEMISGHIGAEYSPIRLFDIVQPYAALEVRLSSVGVAKRRNEFVIRSTGEMVQELDYETKQAATRLGGTFRLGVEGIISNSFTFDMSFAATTLNLFGRDDARGEFLTTDPGMLETNENLVTALQITLTLFYRF